MIVITPEFAIGFILSPISLYIHWPFCKSKCPYCDFNSHVRDLIDHTSMISAYKKELDHFEEILKDRCINTIFFGGGTPSLAEPEVIHEILNHIYKKYNVSNTVEITMEANPTSIESEKFHSLSKSGINRISIGMQSLRDQNLKFLGREHSANEAINAVKTAYKYFNKLSLDFIYSLPKQTLSEWMEELNMIYQLSHGHLSLYQLTIEKGTKFYKDLKVEKFVMPTDEISEEMYISTSEFLEERGMIAYEVSNYASPGNECRHNLNYWNYGDYIGIGAGAHGRYTINGNKHATQMLSSPEAWLNAIEKEGVAFQQNYILSSTEAEKERVIMGMRLSSGITDYMFLNKKKIDFLESVNLVTTNNNSLKCTNRGRLVLNSIIQYLTDEN